MRKPTYRAPSIESARCYETSALACGKTNDPPPGSRHWGTFYQNSFTGHFGPGFGASESNSGTIPPGTGAVTSMSYPYSGLCTNWVTWQS
jgi:hypothetical protein